MAGLLRLDYGASEDNSVASLVEARIDRYDLYRELVLTQMADKGFSEAQIQEALAQIESTQVFYEDLLEEL